MRPLQYTSLVVLCVCVAVHAASGQARRSRVQAGSGPFLAGVHYGAFGLDNADEVLARAALPKDVQTIFQQGYVPRSHAIARRRSVSLPAVNVVRRTGARALHRKTKSRHDLRSAKIAMQQRFQDNTQVEPTQDGADLPLHAADGEAYLKVAKRMASAPLTHGKKSHVSY